MQEAGKYDPIRKKETTDTQTQNEKVDGASRQECANSIINILFKMIQENMSMIRRKTANGVKA